MGPVVLMKYGFSLLCGTSSVENYACTVFLVHQFHLIHSIQVGICFQTYILVMKPDFYRSQFSYIGKYVEFVENAVPYGSFMLPEIMVRCKFPAY